VREEDEAAFAAFVRSRQTHLIWLAQVLGPGGRADAEDLVQTTLIRLASHWERVRDPDAWVRRVLGNLVVDRIRHRARHPVVPVAAPPETATDAGRFEDALGDSERLTRALAKLPPRQRRVVVLRYLADLSEQDTATELQVSVGAVKSAGSRGLGRLRTALTSDTDPSEEARP
jgi:RNA polymerase sigma-70 factor (sigma-E family)